MELNKLRLTFLFDFNTPFLISPKGEKISQNSFLRGGRLGRGLVDEMNIHRNNIMDYKLRSYLIYFLVMLSIVISSCKSGHSDLSNKPLFSLLDKKHTHIDFVNQVDYT
jgi:hypothetical protein